jgi:hypothetical protein
MTTLEKILDIANKAAQVVDIFAPGLGVGVHAGVAVAEDLVTKWNAAHPADVVTLPPTAELIALFAATSKRVVDTGTAFLEPPALPDPTGQP